MTRSYSAIPFTLTNLRPSAHVDRLERLLPAFDSGEDALWIGGPYEGLGIGVCLGDEVVDGGLQVNDGSEHASLEATARELGEEAWPHPMARASKYRAPHRS